MNILVTIVNLGTKNDHHLHAVIEAYRAMDNRCDLVVFTDTRKDLGPNIELRVGLPPEGPVFLPFEVRRLMAERAGQYDLYVYTEDDTQLTEHNIRAFIEADALLPPDEVAGFLRYEVQPDGGRWITTIHGYFSWLLDSPRQVGDRVFAEFLNKHSPAYILTAQHLQRAMDSGQFLRRPEPSPYYNEVEAVTVDVYEHCGLRKMICVSHFEDFLIRHLPGKFLGTLGGAEADVRAQADALGEIAAGRRVPQRLFDRRLTCPRACYDRAYYYDRRDDLLDWLEPVDRSILSIGVGSSELEGALAAQGRDVTVVPLDTVMAGIAEHHGCRALPANLDEADGILGDDLFDALVIADTLEYVDDPVTELRRWVKHVRPGGCVVIQATNLHCREWRPSERKMGGRPQRSRPVRESEFATTGIHASNPRRVTGWMKQAGLTVQQRRMPLPRGGRKFHRLAFGLFDPYFAPRVCLRAMKP